MSLTWLHISDFHFKAGNPYDRDKVLNSLIRLVEEFRLNGTRKPDLIFATGDIANTGSAAEYQLATKFFDRLLEAAGLSKERLYVVPGNHDCNRNKGKGLFKRLEPDQAANYLVPDTQIPHLEERQSEFADWYDSYFGSVRTFKKNSTCHAHPVVLVNGLKIAVLVVNTAIFSIANDDIEQLWIGENCLDSALKELDSSADLKVALMHHPLTWLHQTDRSAIRSQLHGGVHFILSGHLHETEFQKIQGSAGEAMYISAGAAYQGSQWFQGAYYAVVQADHLLIHPVAYSDRARAWALDTFAFPKSQSAGYLGQFSLPNGLVLGHKNADQQGNVDDTIADTTSCVVKTTNSAVSEAVAEIRRVLTDGGDRLKPLRENINFDSLEALGCSSILKLIGAFKASLEKTVPAWSAQRYTKKVVELSIGDPCRHILGLLYALAINKLALRTWRSSAGATTPLPVESAATAALLYSVLENAVVTINAAKGTADFTTHQTVDLGKVDAGIGIDHEIQVMENLWKLAMSGVPYPLAGQRLNEKALKRLINKLESHANNGESRRPYVVSAEVGNCETGGFGFEKLAYGMAVVIVARTGEFDGSLLSCDEGELNALIDTCLEKLEQIDYAT